MSFTNRKDENGQNNMPLGREKCFHDGLRVKNLPANAGDAVLIPGFGRSSGEGNVNVLQYSCLGNPMNRGAWWVTVHRVTRVRHNLATTYPKRYSINPVFYMHCENKKAGRKYVHQHFISSYGWVVDV